MAIVEIYIDFIENKVPSLKSGDYRITARQDFQATGVPQQSFSTKPMPFSIRGDRFSLKPTDIASVFPPPASLGEHSSVLPQVAFRRNTLPWERLIVEPKDEAELEKVNKMPWMALLVFNEGELEQPDAAASTTDKEQGVVRTLGDLKKMNFSNSPMTESGETDQEKLKVIYAKKSLLSRLLAPASVLTRLSHVRESSLRLKLDLPPAENTDLYYEIHDDKGQLAQAGHLQISNEDTHVLDPGRLKPGRYTISATLGGKALPFNKTAHANSLNVSPNDEFGHKVAVLAANRLPRPGARSIVHVVSLEKRYKVEGSDYNFDFGNAENDDLIPLVSLKSWSFNCVNDEHNFDKILTNAINHGKGDTNNTLRLPLRANSNNAPDLSAANTYLQNGYIALPHYFRWGGNCVSWYRGPLVPGDKTVSLPDGLLPATCSDALLIYNEEYGMLDVSCAAAWELGRLLAVRNKKISTSLYNWKRLHQQQLLLAEQQELHPHLPFQHDSSPPIQMPDDIESWLAQLSLLKGLPFNYLVPDEKMLPAESIRFFSLDQDWIACLLDGAFSIGRITPGNQATDQSLYEIHFSNRNGPAISGFLLRSYAVAGWPKLHVDGYKTFVDNDEATMSDNQLTMLRMDRLSPNVLLCLFEGNLQAVDIHQKPEMLHLGFDQNLSKNLRNRNGQDLSKSGRPFATIQLLENYWDPESRIINNFNTLFNTVKSKPLAFNDFTSAQFALSMIEGTQKIRISRR